MNIETFLAHYQLKENPFGAEEARHDPVFERLVNAGTNHPDFPKVLGRLDRPATAVIFGEKGSGKTAMRLLIGNAAAAHNREHPQRRVLVVAHDDFNPMLDSLLRRRKQNAESALEHCRLEDHQDVILSKAVTRLVDALLGRETGNGSEEKVQLPDQPDRVLRKSDRQLRVDLAVMAALYDQPRTGSPVARWRHLRSRLGLLWRMPVAMVKLGATAMTVIAAALAVVVWWQGQAAELSLQVVLGFAVAAALVLWGYWGWRQFSLWRLARRIGREMPAINRTPGELRQMLGELSPSDLARQPFPTASATGEPASDARYQLTRRLLDILGRFNYTGIIVLVDRVDEPTLISGNDEKMKSLVWPMFDNKFLQQDSVGIKLLLPIELRHLLHRESAQFFQEARLDKQNMVDRLTWSGTTLYDLCTARLRACRPSDAEPIALTDLTEADVSRDMLIDALDQMHQPRDAFKFLYTLIQEHCKLVPEEDGNFKIARLTVDSVRRSQSQRVQELYRGLSPT